MKKSEKLDFEMTDQPKELISDAIDIDKYINE